MENLWIIFATGLTVGGLSCLAVQGGLLLSATAKSKNAVWQTAAFLAAKLVAYTILGFALGIFGEVVSLGGVQTYMQLFVGIYMLAIAGNLLGIHPIFRYALVRPPRFLLRVIHRQSKSQNFFAPALLGGMTIFIPCGTTLAMEALAIATANPFFGALIMAVFVLGTMPLFFGIGLATSKLVGIWQKNFSRVAGVAIIYLALTSIIGSFTALGLTTFATQKPESSPVAAAQKIEIDITSRGYSPNYFKVEAGKPVTITLRNKAGYGCASAFRIPSLGISKNLAANQTEIITFTPQGPGKILFTCSMGMYRGIIEVI